jgi:hypothetical protein
MKDLLNSWSQRMPFITWTLVCFTALQLIGCAPASTPADAPSAVLSPASQARMTSHEAQVQSIEIQVLQSNPLQINAVIHGTLTESCASLGESQVQYESNSIQVTVYEVSQQDAGCVQTATPFETSIPLKTGELPVERLTVVANGVSASFTPPVPDQLLGSIGGWIWDDDCADDPAEPGVNCEPVDGSYRGDGLMESNEIPIAGVKMNLGLGACPSTGLEETTTVAADLSYSFAGLEAGTYCVSIDPLDEPNAMILSPGRWTYPSSSEGVAGSTVTLAAGENRFDVNFGWEYQYQAPPSVAQSCTDSAAFVSDVTIPDDSVVTANTAFTKTWRIKNTGTCTWDSTYLVAYMSGTPMSQQPGYWIVPEGQSVAPGQTVDVSIGMTAPVDNGDYASYWGLKQVEGQFIPIQGGANGNSFFVKIKVDDGHADGNITAESITIELEQGSGVACTANSTYFVHVSITADGPTNAAYEVGSTSGQIAAGYFQDANNNLSPYITGTVRFDRAVTKTIHYRFVGPFPYPDDIAVNLRVNGGEWQNTQLSCQ